MAITVITVIGRSGSGKTNPHGKLIAELARRGYAVGTVKHLSHTGFDIDLPGKDSWRHARPAAGTL